jgi:hypothetical protein
LTALSTCASKCTSAASVDSGPCDDEPLRRAAGLAAVVHAAPDGPRNGLVEVGVVEHDERVAAAELHRGLLQVLAGAGRDRATGSDAARERHALDARIVDHKVGLIVGDQQVGVGAFRGAGVVQQLLEGDRALRYATGVLDDQHVAGHQLRARHARQLVVREVPRLHAEQHAERAALHVRMADLGIELRRRQELLGVLRVVGQDVRAELHFAARLVDALAHLERCQLGEIVDMRAHQRGRLVQDDGPLRIAGVLPGLEAGLGRGEGRLELGAVQMLEALENLAVIGVHTLVGHCRILVQSVVVTAAVSMEIEEGEWWRGTPHVPTMRGWRSRVCSLSHAGHPWLAKMCGRLSSRRALDNFNRSAATARH